MGEIIIFQSIHDGRSLIQSVIIAGKLALILAVSTAFAALAPSW
jgi:hypothetical protein